jgi:16S rRNA (guanine527-N7)-methyltransferase
VKPDPGQGPWPGGAAPAFALDEGQLGQLAAMLELLAREPRSPSSVRDPVQAARTHLADSLVALELEPVRAARRLADVGSGAGFPGMPLAVALPHAEVDLIESQRRRCEFLTRMRAAAQVANARVVCTRVEEWREARERYEVVLARALGPQPVVLEYAAPLLAPGGALVDWRGRRSPEQERAAARAAHELGLELQEIRHVLPYEQARDHHLHVFVKLAATPARFPRRPGIARKRPLG